MLLLANHSYFPDLNCYLSASDRYTKILKELNRAHNIDKPRQVSQKKKNANRTHEDETRDALQVAPPMHGLVILVDKSMHIVAGVGNISFHYYLTLV